MSVNAGTAGRVVRLVAAACAVPVLYVRYGEAVAIGDLSFSVNTGAIVGFPGSGGAGKTTAAEMLDGFRHRTAGEAGVLMMW